jgi:hypothetical protein
MMFEDMRSRKCKAIKAFGRSAIAGSKIGVAIQIEGAMSMRVPSK